MGRLGKKLFSATLERGSASLGWTIVHIPQEVTAGRITGSRPRVKGEINGFAFRTSLFPTGNNNYYLLVNKKMQAGAKVKLGGLAEIFLEPDTEERVVTVPQELKRALAEDRTLRRWYDQLSESIRRDICTWIEGVKSAEARTRRADQIAERLLATMEAEKELPPILKAAFMRTPVARKGWEAMSASHRRRELFGIFYYRNPESRENRLNKTIEECIRIAQLKTSRK